MNDARTRLRPNIRRRIGVVILCAVLAGCQQSISRDFEDFENLLTCGMSKFEVYKRVRAKRLDNYLCSAYMAKGDRVYGRSWCGTGHGREGLDLFFDARGKLRATRLGLVHGFTDLRLKDVRFLCEEK